MQKLVSENAELRKIAKTGKLTREDILGLLTEEEVLILKHMKKAVFDPKNPPKTQDEIHQARIAVLMQLNLGNVKAPEANALLKGLLDASNHLEMFGGEEGAEGGSRVLRLLPGMTLVERQDLASMPLRMEELKLLQLGMDDDRKHGVKPPLEMEVAVVRYLGKPRAARTVYNERMDPEGIRFYTQGGSVVITYAEMEQRAKKRWARIRREEKEAAAAAREEPKDDGELRNDLIG